MDNKSIALLTEISSNLLKSKLTPWQAFRNGILSGLGAALGATLVLAILLGILSQLVSIPIVGNYIKQVVDVVDTK